MFVKIKELLGMQQPAKTGKMGAKGAVIGAVSQMPQQQLAAPMARPMQPMVSQKAPLTNRPTFAGNLNPATEDGYDTTIKYLSGSMPQQQVADYIPGNFAGRPIHAGAMQGSNPFRNMPQRNIYQNISPFDQDTMLRGGQIQSPDLDRYY